MIPTTSIFICGVRMKRTVDIVSRLLIDCVVEREHRTYIQQLYVLANNSYVPGVLAEVSVRLINAKGPTCIVDGSYTLLPVPAAASALGLFRLGRSRLSSDFSAFSASATIRLTESGVSMLTDSLAVLLGVDKPYIWTHVKRATLLNM